MTRLLRSEFLKIRTTQTAFWLLLLTLALTALITCIQVFVITRGGSDSGAAALGSPESIRQALGSVATTGPHLIMLCLGVLVLSGEFRHNTITPTLLASPRRAQVVAAKLAIVTMVGLVFAAAALALALAIALPWLAAAGGSVSLGSVALWRTLAGNALVLVLYGLIGLGVGALIRNQVVAVVVSIVFVWIVDTVLTLVFNLVSWLRPAAGYLPGQAASSLEYTYVPTPQGDGGGVDVAFHLLPQWGGGLVLLAYALVFCALGIGLTLYRDIT